MTGTAETGFKPVPADSFSRWSNSPLPPKDWKEGDFEDGGWMRTRGALGGGG